MNRPDDRALTQNWWMSKHPKIRAVLAEVHLEDWVPKIRHALKENKKAGRCPATWESLAASLDRNWRNLKRWVAGTYWLTLQDLLGLSTVLHLECSDFFPATADWIAKAAVKLCPGRVSNAQARAYALYRLGGVGGTNPEISAHAAQNVLADREIKESFHDVAQVTDAIRAVAKSLGEVLEELEAGGIQ